jgi:hypothetical protein
MPLAQQPDRDNSDLIALTENHAVDIIDNAIRYYLDLCRHGELSLSFRSCLIHLFWGSQRVTGQLSPKARVL